MYTPGQSEHSVFIGNNLTLICTYDGVPTPMIQWFHNDIELMNDTDITNGNGRSVLLLNNVELGSGGNYTCQAVNSVETDSITITVATLMKSEY